MMVHNSHIFNEGLVENENKERKASSLLCYGEGNLDGVIGYNGGLVKVRQQSIVDQITHEAL